MLLLQKKKEKENNLYAVVAKGVDSLAVEGKNKDQLVLVGDDIDMTSLTIKLRKKMGHAVIVKVEEVKPAKADPKPQVPSKEQSQWNPPYLPYPHLAYYDITPQTVTVPSCEWLF